MTNKTLEEAFDAYTNKRNGLYIKEELSKRRVKAVSKWGRTGWYIRACDYIAARYHQVFRAYR